MGETEPRQDFTGDRGNRPSGRRARGGPGQFKWIPDSLGIAPEFAPQLSDADIVRLREAVRLARPLSFLDMAARYREQRPSVAALHPWMRDLVPEALRRVLAELA